MLMHCFSRSLSTIALDTLGVWSTFEGGNLVLPQAHAERHHETALDASG